MTYTYDEVLKASMEYLKDETKAKAFVDSYALKNEKGEYLELSPLDMEKRSGENIVHGILIDKSRDSLFDEHGLIRLKDSYMKEDETSPQERYAFVSKNFSTDAFHAQRLYEYSSKHWLSYSTPILSFGRSNRGLNISCYLSMIPDTSEGLVNTLSEVNNLSMLGGGVGIHVKIRGADEKSVGVMPHLKTYDASSLAYRQGKTRRGSYAAFLDISHPDIIQFIEMRKATGDQNMKALNLHHGVNISDEFMQIIEKCMLDDTYDDTWELKNPHNNKVVDKISAKYLWEKLLDLRMHTGEPYFIFIDHANKQLPDWLKKEQLQIHGSNLCVEGDTKITISISGKEELIKISDFATKWLFGYYVDKQVLVKSFSEDTKNIVWSVVEAAAETGKCSELMEIETESGKIVRCTPEHKILTKNRGWIEAQHLLEDDELFDF